jgi:starch-binding outer membrane protein, SusD/RagB family
LTLKIIKMKIINRIIMVTALSSLVAMGCKKNFDNPNAATSASVLNSARSLVGIAAGIQRIYSVTAINNIESINSLTTGETSVINVGNLSEAQLSAGGGTVDNGNGLLNSLWTVTNKCIFDANNVLDKSVIIGDKNYASGLIGYISIFKALSIGTQSMFWENVPNNVGSTNATFISRVDGFNKAIATIDNALATIAANPISASFLSDMPAGIDIVNTLQALKARYSLFLGNYATALSSASAVDLTKVSTLNYEAAIANPVFQTVTSSNNVYKVVDSTLGLPLSIRPDLADARTPFYTVYNPPSPAPRFIVNGFWSSTTRAIPIYLVDEMRLIIAECLLRQTAPDPASAQTLLSNILKQTAAADPNGVGANIAAGYTGTSDVPSLLTEVYRNRCIELFMSGLKLEDMRRFGRPITERKRNFFPYPLTERQNNPNTPADPVF